MARRRMGGRRRRVGTTGHRHHAGHTHIAIAVHHSTHHHAARAVGRGVRRRGRRRARRLV